MLEFLFFSLISLSFLFHKSKGDWHIDLGRYLPLRAGKPTEFEPHNLCSITYSKLPVAAEILMDDRANKLWFLDYIYTFHFWDLLRDCKLENKP